MKIWKAIIRASSIVALGFISAIASFGVMLALVWSISGDDGFIKAVGASGSAGLAIVVGGFITAWITKGSDLRLPIIFGWIFGGISFTYILSLDSLVLFLVLVSCLLAVAGVSLYHSIAKARIKGIFSAG